MDSFFNRVQNGDIIIARKGRKQIAAIGIAEGSAFYKKGGNIELYSPDKPFSNHLKVNWLKKPRNKVFKNIVFGMQTIYEIPEEKYNTLIENRNYYVYVYIDPRNNEEFYYGKGIDSRKNAHLIDTSDTPKTTQIAEIRREKLNPTIRVIARGLSDNEAQLVEKTLLWKLGKYTTNISSGSFSNRFRPNNTLHKELPGFDYQNGIYYYNVGEGSHNHRNWDDYRKFGFISACQGKQWRNAMLGFCPGDIVVAYLKSHGFVGIGKIQTRAKMIREVIIHGKPLLSLSTVADQMDANCNNPERSEYVCKVKWIKKYSREKAKWKSHAKLYTTTHIRASLENQRATLRYLQRVFKVSFKELIA